MLIFSVFFQNEIFYTKINTQKLEGGLATLRKEKASVLRAFDVICFVAMKVCMTAKQKEQKVDRFDFL